MNKQLSIVQFVNESAPNNNPYISQLFDALANHPLVSSVVKTSEFDTALKFSPDIVHFHWPEILSSWRKPNSLDISNISNKLDELSKKSKLVATVHNIESHSNPKEFRELYYLLFSKVDYLIHMGYQSTKLLEDEYGVLRCQNWIVPHGDYSFFENKVNQQQAREKLGIDEAKRVVASVGAIRSTYEYKLLMSAFRKAKKADILLIGGSLPRTTRIFRMLRKLRFFLSPSIIYVGNRVKDIEMQVVLNAADCLFISRGPKALNSGNVALGYTFGKTVVGPSTGVIGVTLAEAGNPIYFHEKPESAATALDRGIRLADEGQGNINIEYCNSKMQWPEIVRQLISIYLSIQAGTREKKNLSISAQDTKCKNSN